MNVIYTTQPIEPNVKSIFLAGPSPRSDDVESWRPQAIQYLRDMDFDGIVYNPEHENGQEGFSNCDYPPDWEHSAIKASTVLLFWIPRDLDTMPAFTTNVEFGYFVKEPIMMMYGRPDNSPKNRYLDWLMKKERPDVPIYTELKSLIQEAVNISNIIEDLKQHEN